jgi:hypothetical protein
MTDTQTAEMKLRAELRMKPTVELHRLVTSRETPEALRNKAQEVLWERGKIENMF